MPKQYDYCILGAGLAGVSLAHELSKENASVCLVDPKGIASGASGTPLGLVNPATGRFASLTWKPEECYSSILENLNIIQEQSSVRFFKKSGVLRPALEEKIATRMKENFNSMPWPEGWIKWLDEKELKNFHPQINCRGGGVWLPIGLTVDISTYLKEFVTFLAEKGIMTLFKKDYSVNEKENYWGIDFQNGERVLTQKLIYTTGSETNDVNFWNEIPLHPIKGQLAVLESDSPLSFDHAVSALGYISSLSKSQFVIGSTYEHKFDHLDSDAKGLDYLLNRLEKVLPDLKNNSKVISQWAGVRASTPNRMPIIGAHPNKRNLYIFAGLGSKGLLYSAFLAKKCSLLLIDNTPVHPEVDLARF